MGKQRMDKQQIINYVNTLFEDVPMSGLVHEQKEELQNHLEEQINDYMAEGHSFEDALEASKNDLGDINELIQEFTTSSSVIPKSSIQTKSSRWRRLNERNRVVKTITVLSILAYVLMGAIMGGQAWAIGWVIIPLSRIFAKMVLFKDIRQLVKATPFIYVGLGLWLGGMFWAWGWIIIPISAIWIPKPDKDFIVNCKKKIKKRLTKRQRKKKIKAGLTQPNQLQ